MFTGLVLGMGEVVKVSPGAGESRFAFRPLFPVKDWVKGESVAVNGVCLSVESFDASSFGAYASHETLRLSNLGNLKAGDRVNLERALALGDRLGGHLVSGHADGTATVESVRVAGASLVVRVRYPEEFSSQVIAKGSVALDGVSLTINKCGPGFLEVNVIPETQKSTTVGAWTPGRVLNFESDLIGKYVESLLGPWKEKSASSRLTLDFLRDNGF
ncbi:riboflavin synthase [Desulfovibrio sp. OttesenSCG-928-M14]|nr:riboflavin synthase [Desulfovibrio sp. OttesenSCG-928-M14]